MFSMVRAVIIPLCLAMPWAGVLVPHSCFGFESAELNATAQSTAAEAAAAPSNILTITTYNGGDEGHLISFPDSTTMSIDCANGNITTKSHFHSDHCASCGNTGQYNRNNVSPGQVIYNKDGVTVTVVAANGQVIGEGLVDVPCDSGDENPLSMALWIKYGGFDYLTAGDMYGSVEGPLGAALKARGVSVDVLKVSHHGTGTNGSSSLNYLNNIKPEFATISGEETDPLAGGGTTIPNLITAGVKTIYCIPDYGLPPPVPAQVYTANGDITITTDGCTFSFSGGNPSFHHGPYNVDEPCYHEQPPHLVISEVAVASAYVSPEDHRWIELSLPPAASAVNLADLYWVSKGQRGRLAKYGALTMAPGDVAILHNTDASDPRTDENNDSGKGWNGWWDLYTHLNGNYWVTTEDCVILSRENAALPKPINILDAVLWSNYDGSTPANAISVFNYLIANFHWGNPIAGSGSFNSSNDSCGIGNITTGYAQRTTTGDTDSVQDWVMSAVNSEGTPPPTPGNPPEPTATPPPRPIVVVLNSTAFEAGDTLTVDVVAQPLTGRPFDAYAAVMRSGGGILFWIRPGNLLSSGQTPLPLATKVGSLPNGYSGRLLSVTIPPGSEGDYRIGAGLVDAGKSVKKTINPFIYDIAGLSVR